MGASNIENVQQLEEFIAGLIYGLVQDDELTEIEACLQGGSQLEQQVTDAIADLREGDLKDIIDGIELMG